VGDAEYIIEVAGKAAGVDTTTAEMDRLAAELSAAGKGAAVFQDAIAKVSSQLSAAQGASEAASGALASGSAEYALLERGALQASKAFEKASLDAITLAIAAEKAAAKSAAAMAAVDRAPAGANMVALRARADDAASAADKLAVRAHQAADAADTLAASSAAATAAVDAQARVVGGLEKGALEAATAEKQLAKSLDGVRRVSGHVDKTLSRSSETLSKMQGGIASVGGPLAKLSGAIVAPAKGFADLRQVVGGARAGLIVAAVGVGVLSAAIVALAAAALAGVAAIAGLAAKLADTRRSAELTAEAFAAVRPELSAIDFAGLTSDTGVASDRLRALAKTLTDAKVSAADLPRALRAASLAEAALGQGGADDFIASLREGKTSVTEFANITERKLGGIVARQMLGLEAQGARLKRNLGDLFGGLKIDSVLEAMGLLVGFFDKTSSSGKALQFLFETVFQPIIDGALKAAQVVEGFALGFLIGLTKMYIAAKPAIKAVADFFGFENTSLEDVCKAAAKAGEFAAKAFVVVVAILGALAAVVGVVVGLVFALAAALSAALTAAVVGVVLVVKGLVQAFVAAYEWLIGVEWSAVPAAILDGISAGIAAVQAVIESLVQSIVGFFTDTDFAGIGRQVIAGLAEGITGAAGVVVSAVKNAIGGAIKAAKSMLGISSPSRVFAGLGEYTGEGYVGGVEDMTADAHAAAEELVASPRVSASDLASSDGVAVASPSIAGALGVASGASAPVGRTVTVSMAGARIEFHGVKDAEDAVSRFGEWLTLAIEGDAAALGGATP